MINFFKSKAVQVMEIGEWRINFVCHESDQTKGKAPVVILGGAFQRFESFKKDVQMIGEHFPVLLVDLPGQGGNEQRAKDLSFEEYAHLLKSFIDCLKIREINLISLSYGSAIGFHFANYYPEHTQRLILAGTSHALRLSTRRLLEESLELLERGEDELFAQAVVLNLMNYPRRREIKGAELLARGLYRSMKRLTADEKLRYGDNTRRLLNCPHLPEEGSNRETLVVAGEWDHFTTPFECFEVAKRHPRNVLAIIKEADHLAPYMKKEAVNTTFISFLKGERLQSTSEVSIYRDREYPAHLRQVEPRYACHREGVLQSLCGKKIAVQVEDLNLFGCKLVFEKNMLESGGPSTLTLCLPNSTLSLGVIPFHRDGANVSALFKRTDFGLIEKMEQYLKELSLSNLTAA